MNLRWLGQAERASLLLYAALQFIVLTIIAMIVYPGGAVFALSSAHYLFFQNFFSDLGATQTPSGHSNIPSHILFIVALASVGLALMLFSTTWRTIVDRRHAGRRLGLAAQWVALVAGIGFIGIAVTPWNHVLDAHNAFVRLAFGLLLMYVLLLIAIQLQNDWPRVFIMLNVLYVLVLIAYVTILFGGPALSTKSGLEFQVTAQKIIVYSSIVGLGLQAFAMRSQAASGQSAWRERAAMVET